MKDAAVGALSALGGALVGGAFATKGVEVDPEHQVLSRAGRG